jgi:hypothetical protein
VREIILKADPLMTEYLKSRTVRFVYEGDLAAFVHLKDKHVTLMFYRGARIEGDFPTRGRRTDGALHALCRPRRGASARAGTARS